jgi:hypothetical protein
MDWTNVLIVVGVVVMLGAALVAFGVLNSLGYGPDIHAPESEEAAEPGGSRD